jgi:hypothetical protein
MERWISALRGHAAKILLAFPQHWLQGSGMPTDVQTSIG